MVYRSEFVGHGVEKHVHILKSQCPSICYDRNSEFSEFVPSSVGHCIEEDLH